jgi:Fur family ferric uptake transcriptional regulator
MIASTQTNYPMAVSAKASETRSPVELATAKLKAAGLRITQPRLLILAALSAREQPSTIEQLHQDVGHEKCDLVTVYRCMAAFEEIGLARRAFFHNGTALYEINLGQPTRFHLYCKATNQVVELDADTTAELSRAVANVQETLRSRGYGEVAHLVEFFGIAPSAVRMNPAPAVEFERS